MDFLFKNNKFRFFEVILITAAIIISIFVIQTKTNTTSSASEKNETSFIISPGWNLVSPSFSTSMTAKSFCKEFSQITSVVKWESQSWKEYACKNPVIANFPILANNGYFIRVDVPETIIWKDRGKLLKPGFKFEEGWNVTGIVPSLTGYKNADDICLKSPNPNFKILEINRWYNGGWNAHVCEYPFNNFSLEDNKAYFIKAVLVGSNPNKKIAPLSLPK